MVAKIKKNLMSKTGFITTRFSKAHLLAFSVVFAIIGGYFIYRTYAAGSCSSINQYAVTFTFDKSYSCGQYANGDWWVLGPAMVTAISPAFDGTNNGWEVNPVVQGGQGFDGNCNGGQFNPSLVPALPYQAQAGQSIVKSVTSGQSGRGCLQTAVVLTIVGSVPPGDGSGVFRPPYVGTSKPTISVSELQTNLLPSLAPVANMPSLATVESEFSRVWLDHKTGMTGRAIHPLDNMEDYGAEIGWDIHEGALRLMLNEPLSAKMPALIKYVQTGIDQYYMFNIGQTWPDGDGHRPGHRLILAFAATMLNKPDWKAALNATTALHEDRTITSQARDGTWLYGYDNDEARYWETVATDTGQRSRVDPYLYVDGGSQPAAPYGICCVIQPWKGEILATYIMPSLQSAWNPNEWSQTASLIDRWVAKGAKAAPDPCAPLSQGGGPNGSGGCKLDPDLAYYNSPTDFACKPGLQCGRFPSSVGSNIDGGLRYSVFARDMWNAYRNSAPTPPPPPPAPPPPASAIYSDDFERTILGSNWIVHNGSPGIVDRSDLGLLPSTVGILSWASSVPADQFSEATISATSDERMAKGVYVRRNASTAARYQFHFDTNGTEAEPRPHWQIKYDGVPSAQARVIATSLTPAAPVAGDELRIEAQSNTIKGFKNDVLVLQATDSVLTSGTIGVAFTTAGLTTIPLPSPVYESWRGGALDSSSSPPTVSLSANPTSIASGSSSTLSWTSTNATSCTASGAWSGSKNTSGTQSVTPTTTSIYNLSCTGTGGTATASATATVTVSTTPPPPPSDTTLPTLDITTPTAGSTVSGTFNAAATATDNVGVTKVDFLVNGVLAGSDTTSPYNYSWNTTTLANGTHTITAKAYDAAGNTASEQVAVNVSNGDTTPPSVPTNPTATASAYNRVNLSWAASSDNVAVTGYYIVRNGVTIAQSTDTSHADSTVNGSTSYSYQVMAFDAKGNTSPLSNTASVTTPAAPDTAPPSIPTGLTATAVSTSQVNLSWSPSTDYIGVTGYDVYRSSAGSTATKVATVTTTSFGNTGLSASTTYSYYVIARDAAGNTSSQSNAASATTQPLPPPPPAPATGHLTGHLTGTVTSSSTHSGISRATVSTYVGTAKWTTKTTSIGQYSLPSLPAGSYQVKYTAKQHVSQTQQATITRGQTTSLNVTLVRR